MTTTPETSRKVLLTITAVTASAIGALALFGPDVLIQTVKTAAPSATANVMARTVGVLLMAIGLLNFLVRRHGNSPTMRAILTVNLALQIGIMPIDPLAFLGGTYATLGSFVPNTILHILLAAGFAWQLRAARVASSGTTR